MARRTPRPSEPGFFDSQERAERRRQRRQRALFIPRLLREAAQTSYLPEPGLERAHKIAIRWAELESSGHLIQHKETSIDTQFLDQLFGEGLGYRVKTASPDAWEMEHKFTVAGVGTADAALGEFPAKQTTTVV